MRIGLIAITVLLTAGCGDNALTICYLRSDSYEFSRQDRRTIGAIAESVLAEARRLLPALPARIEMTVRPGSDVIAETGETASVTPPDGLVWTVDPTRAGGVVAVANAWLRASLLHEFHHLVRSANASPQSIVDHAIFEGMATVFERDVAGVAPPWGQYSSVVEQWEGELLQLPTDASRKEWLYDHPDGRRWIGIKVGAFWVDRARAKSGKSAAELVATPVSEILTLAGVERQSLIP
ncbi:MAG TPA: DUF2268 domain-containing putative Zn-dependent protease [Vicinamibacterales bacterium]